MIHAFGEWAGDWTTQAAMCITNKEELNEMQDTKLLCQN